MKLKFFLLLFGLIGAVRASAVTPTATLAAGSVYLLPQGGTATLTVTVDNYAATTSALGVTLTLPSGWAYAGGTGGPDVKPLAGDTGTLGWAYITIPGSPASFSFNVTYPAAAGTPSLSAPVVVRDSGTRTDLVSNAVNFLQATAPVVTNVDPHAATYRASFVFNVSATSPIPITGYGASGLPTGLMLNAATGQISGAPTQTGPFTVTLSATNDAGTGTKDVLLTVNPAEATVTLSSLTQTYNGAQRPVTVTTTPAGLGVDVLYDGSSTVPVYAGSYAVTATINNPNYTGSTANTLTIQKASQSISFPPPAGQTRPNDTLTLTATASSGGPVTFTVESGPATVNGTTLKVTGAGAIVVRATQVGDDNYLPASVERTLNSNKLAQTVTFELPPTMKARDTLTLVATASSGQPVTFTVESGSGKLDGAVLTATGGGAIVVRATQVGDDVYAAASVQRTINAQKLEQTITFAPLDDRSTSPRTFDLVATASSGLPVTFTIVDGPAQVQDTTVRLTGVAGDVKVQAMQGGNTVYLAASPVTRSFHVTAAGDSTFFGQGTHHGTSAPGRITARDVEPAGEVAAVIPAGGNTGSLLIVAPAIGLNELIGFTVGGDGTFALTATQTTADGPQTISGTGLLNGSTLSGSFEAMGFDFTTQLEPADGPSAASQGLYISTALGTNSGSTFTIIGSNNEVLVLVVTPTATLGGRTQLQDNGTFSVASGNLAVAGTVDEPTTTVAAALTITTDQGSATIGFGGLKSTTTRTDRLINLSSRAYVGSGENVLIAGFVIGGRDPKPVLIRAVGPGLAPLGVDAVLANPQIRVVREGRVVATNEDWGGTDDSTAIAQAAARIGAFALTPGSTDSALLTTLAPGIYTAIVSGGDGAALAEIYDASENPQADYQRLVNISSRGYVGAGDKVLIGGLVVTGNAPKRIMIRAVGPTLATQGLTTPLADPVLKVFRGSSVIATNDNWDADPAAAAALQDAVTKTGAFPLPAGSKDAAIILTLAPGIYTMHVRPADNSTPGIALAEIYEVPE